MLPNKFQLANARAIASYQWQEVASAESYVTFYAFTSRESDGVITGLTPTTKYNLSENVYNSFSEELDTTSSTSNPAVVTNTWTFSTTEFNAPRIVNSGVGYIQLTYKETSAAGNGYVYPKLQLIHYDGTTETVIGTAYGPESDATQEHIIPITITQKKFKIGDVLRLKLSNYTFSTVGGAVVGKYAINPLNTDTTNFTSVLTYFRIAVPFRIFE